MYHFRVRIALLSFLMVVANSVSGQSLDIEAIKQDGSYSFPLFLGNNTQSSVSEKLNVYLQLRYLSQVPDAYVQGDPFHVVKNRYECSQIIFQDFRSTYVNSKILEIALDIEQLYCTGVGLDWYTSVEYFDVVHGEKIDLTDIFSPDGMRSLKTQTIKAMRAQLEKHIAEANTVTKQSELDEQDRQFAIDQSSFYQDCLSNTDTSNFRYYQYRITEDAVVIRRDKCYWNETGRALDEKSVPEVTFSLDRIAPWLSDYGNAILTVNDVITTNPSLKNKLLKGYVGGKYPIKAIIREFDEHVSILYWYEKTKQPLLWEGRQRNGKYFLKEKIYQDDDSEFIANITLNFVKKGEKWSSTGMWRSLNNGKMLSIHLREY